MQQVLCRKTWRVAPALLGSLRVNASSCRPAADSSVLTAALWQSDFSWPLNLLTACFQLLKRSDIKDRFTNIEQSFLISVLEELFCKRPCHFVRRKLARDRS